ncbi:MAG: DinB family protein [Bryobacteraceae bacterium]|nr:DinB family protein [Bryobacteraceae bacterium]
MGLTVVFAAGSFAQDAANPLIAGSKSLFEQAKNVIMRSAEKMPEEHFSYKPTEGVRGFGAILGHVADAQYFFCGAASGQRVAPKGVEKSATTKEAIIAGLKESFAFCDSVYAKMTDANAAEMVSLMGQRTKLSALDFNVAHNYEHYGNLVTYMRMKNIVPPSSEPRR